MKTPLKQVLERLKVISELVELESSMAHCLTRPSESKYDLLYGYRPGQVPVTEPLPCRSALEGFLAALPPHYVQAIAALMVAGSHEDGDVIAHWKWSGGYNYLDARRAIATKRMRWRYIQASLDLSENDDYINELPEYFENTYFLK